MTARPRQGISQGAVVEPAQVRRRQTEAELARSVEKLARLYGWSAYHTRFSIGSQPGFPDYVFWKPGRLLFVELKGDGGTVTAKQRTCLDGLMLAGARVFVWRPVDLEVGAIEEVLA